MHLITFSYFIHFWSWNHHDYFFMSANLAHSRWNDLKMYFMSC